MLQFVGFQLVWFSAILGAAHELPWLGAVVGSLYLCLHVLAEREPVARRAELRFILLVGLAGLVCDSLLSAAGITSYARGGETLPDVQELIRVLVLRHLNDGFSAPAIRRPFFGHDRPR